MYPWVPLHILVTSPWDPPLTLAWEVTRVLAWDTGDQALVITAWEVLAQSILVWGDRLQDTLQWEDPVLFILAWEDPVLSILAWEDPVLFILAWGARGLSPCPLRKSILQTSPWSSILRTRTLLQFIPAASVIKRSMTTIRWIHHS